MEELPPGNHSSSYGSLEKSVEIEIDNDPDIEQKNTRLDCIIDAYIIFMIFLFIAMGIICIAVSIVNDSVHCDKKHHILSLSEWLIVSGIVNVAIAFILLVRIVFCYFMQNFRKTMVELISESALTIVLIISHTLYSLMMIIIGIIVLAHNYTLCHISAPSMGIVTIIVVIIKLLNIINLLIIALR